LESESFQSSFDIREVAEEVGISKAHVMGFSWKNLGMPCVAAKFVLCLLKKDQKQTCVDVSKEPIDCANADEIFIKNIVTGDETWVYSYVVETKVQYSHWVSKSHPDPNKHVKFSPM